MRALNVSLVTEQEAAVRDFEHHFSSEVLHVLLREADSRVARDELGKHAAEDAAVAAVLLHWTVSYAFDGKVARVERNLSFVHRLVFQVLLKGFQDRRVRMAHGVIVSDSLITHVNDRHAPMHSTHVHWNWNDVDTENIHFPGPSSHSAMALLQQLTDEESVHYVNFWQEINLLTTVLDQLHVEIDDFVV